MSTFRVCSLILFTACASVGALAAQTDAGRAKYPNQPVGYTPFAAYDASVYPGGEGGSGGMTGDWISFPARSSNLIMGEDLHAPVSPPGVIRTRFPAGLLGGRAPVNFSGWDHRGPPASPKSKFYLSLWLRIDGSEFENHMVGTKMGFIAYGLPLSAARNQATFMLSGRGGRVSIGDRWKIQFNQQWPVNRNLYQNRDQRPLMSVGVWHHWEAVFELNDLYGANGVMRMWIDGQLIMDYHDIKYVVPGHGLGFNLWKWNPTWGGERGVRSRDDYVSIDDIMISGVDVPPDAPKE